MAHRLKNHRAHTVNEPGKQGQHRPSTKQLTVARRKYGGITQAAAELLDRPQCIQGSQTFGNMVIQKVEAAGRTGEYGHYKEKHSPVHGAEHATAFLPSPPLSSTKAAQIHCKKKGKPQKEKVRVQHWLRKRDWRHSRVWSSVQENRRTLTKPADERAKAQLIQAGSVCPRAASSPPYSCQALGRP